MNARFSDRAIQIAARWYARLQAFDCTPAERQEFERWCGEDPMNAAAYAAARDMAARITRAAASNARLRAMTEQALAAGAAQAAASHARRRLAMGAALAASIVGAVGIVGTWRSAPESHPAASVSHAATEGEMRVLTLEDGTVVHLDVNSDIEVQLGAARREVSLRQGRAMFDVAHDPLRPFSVAAEGGRVTAVGTRFQVERTAAEMVVTLAEGIVTVSGEPGGALRTERLVPGDELSISVSDRVWLRRTVDPRITTSWSSGRLVFRTTRLADALEEVNRYATTKVRIADSSLEDLPVSGNFIAGDSEAAVGAFAAVLPLAIATDGDELLLYRRASE